MNHPILAIRWPWCACVAWLVLQGAAQAQNPALMRAQPFTGLHGKVVKIESGVIQWTDDSKKPYYAMVNNLTHVSVIGDGSTDLLTAGSYVRFEVEMNKNMKPTGEVQEVTVFTPINDNAIGIAEDPNAGPDDKTIHCTVAGELQSFRNGLLNITIGDDTVKAKLAEGATIKADISDCTMAKQGDEITLTGMGQMKEQIVARTVEIKLSEPLASSETKPKKKARGSAASKKTRKPRTKKPADDSTADDPNSFN